MGVFPRSPFENTLFRKQIYGLFYVWSPKSANILQDSFLFQMVEKSRRSPESKDIFELQYQTNCSVNVSYNFTNSDLQDAAENKVWKLTKDDFDNALSFI